MVSNSHSSFADDGSFCQTRSEQFSEAMLLRFLREASTLPGRGPSAMAIMLANQCRHLDRHEHILVMPKTLRRYGLTSITGYRALEQLQSAGLIEVHRRRGQGPTVTLLKNNAQASDVEEREDV